MMSRHDTPYRRDSSKRLLASAPPTPIATPPDVRIISTNPAVLFHAMEGRIQRPLLDAKQFGRDPLEAPGLHTRASDRAPRESSGPTIRTSLAECRSFSALDRKHRYLCLLSANHSGATQPPNRIISDTSRRAPQERRSSAHYICLASRRGQVNMNGQRIAEMLPVSETTT